MANWKKIVSSANARRYKWPSGWETRDKIAEQLDCSPERVADVLAPAIKAGEIERAVFPVWDAENHRKVLVTGYREAVKPAAAPAKRR
jgi:L-amino acid N-acyltransferase YncA